MTKYSEIMSITSIKGKIKRMTEEEREKLMNLQVFLTEKIHGCNYRQGIDEHGRRFIGTRNVCYFFDGTDYISERDGESLHPNWNFFNDLTKKEIERVFCWIEREWKGNPIVFFAEVYGNNIQQGFTYDTESNGLVYFDIYYENKYFPPLKASKIFLDLGIEQAPIIKTMTFNEFLNEFDVTRLKSEIANESYVEGVVAKPVGDQKPEWWDFADRLIVKKKIPRFAEQKSSDSKKKKNRYESSFVQFVVEERLNHILADLKEEGHELSEDKDFRFLVVERMIVNIQKEEHENEPFEERDRKSLATECHKLFSMYLAKGGM